ncbi:hypothetical protein K504DRAFT_439390 [Pleomassaria siparia CBS 279.74]|uniref:Nucleolar 27S pre-rRNA processing Urb2/Npa2 C-terminal domain-containing protein n=1 Tax=Pleomassaria siparia CBS 279.74 TaxID=1314801 RepID=A0A6G1JZE5_9PLEO|nr:hypothetical protein K504DRAFT_439390 [Pleomassaria siparia CBS 279.74]
MAPVLSASQTPSVPTLPRLLAINKNFTDLNEQIRQATHIIGLPEDWDAIQEEKARSNTIQNLVRARAEWVLRWILDKLKDDAELGVQARANIRAWKLLNRMIQVLPTSRLATHLRDSSFLTVLEKTLEENFENNVTIQAVAANSNDPQLVGTSESSETAQEDPKPSRKRKRPSSGTTTPSKKVALETRGLEQLLEGITTVLKSMVDRTSAHGDGDEIVYTEHMKMALRTESFQAARILKYWLGAVQKLLSTASGLPQASTNEFLDLNLVLEIWELRTIDADDELGASAEQFSTECLIPTLTLYNKLQDSNSSDTQDQRLALRVRTAIQDLERLLARHLFAASRAAFFTDKKTESSATDGTVVVAANSLASNLAPLRAKLLQAAQILDTSEPLPSFFIPLFQAISQLLDMAIRFSPSRTPKTKVAEKPWIQAVFVALAECVGCSLEAPEFAIPIVALIALERSLHTLVVHDMTIDSQILEDLFWFHSGVKFPLKKERTIHWSLIAALIELDSGLFLTKPKSSPAALDDRPEDLTNFLFDLISTIQFENSDDTDSEKMDIDTPRQQHISSPPQNATAQNVILRSIVLPMLSAYARNRDLLGFVRRWEVQLFEENPDVRSPLQDAKARIWQDRSLVQALADKFEESLTKAQILDLFKKHANRIQAIQKTIKGKPPVSADQMEDSRRAFGSAVIIYAILGSIQSDDITEYLQPFLLPLFESYTTMVGSDWHRTSVHMEIYWKTMCQLLHHLWYITLHGSPNLQASLILPVVTQASKDVTASRKGQGDRPITSKTRTAIIVFLLTTSDHLKTVPGQNSVVQDCIRKVLKMISGTRLELVDLRHVVEIFCTDYPHLLEALEPEACEKALLSLLYRLAEMNEQLGTQIADALSDAIFGLRNTTLQATYSAALLSAVDETNDNEILRVIIDNAFLRIHPSALHRDRREAILNKMTEIIMTSPRNVDQLLSIMCHFMEIPNATAKVSSDGSLLFDLAENLQEKKLELPLTMRLFQDFVRLTLSHILPNKNQAQNKRFLETFEAKLSTTTYDAGKRTAGKLAIMRATFMAQKENDVLPAKLYITYLLAALHDEAVSRDYVVDAFNEIPSVALREKGDSYNIAKDVMRTHVYVEVDLKKLLSSNGDEAIAARPTKYWVRLHTTLGSFGLYSDPTWFVEFSLRILQEKMTEVEQATIMRSFAAAVSAMDNATRLSLVQRLVHSESTLEKRRSSYRLLHLLVSALDDKHMEDAEQKQQQLTIVPRICALLAESPNVPAFNSLVNSVDVILREKHSLVTQHNIECILAVLVKLAARNSPSLSCNAAPSIYTRLCETSRLILVLHRSRIGGRFHLVLPLLQNLLFCLFIPNTGRGMPLPPWLKSASSHPARLTPANASHFTRLVSTLCSPTHFSVQKRHHKHNTSQSTSNTKPALNDPVKAAREYASHYLYPLLGSFCRYQLSGRLEAEVRKKLMTGIWEVVGVAAMDRASLDSMFAGLDGATRDVWRGLWSEYVRGNPNGGRDRENERNGFKGGE